MTERERERVKGKKYRRGRKSKREVMSEKVSQKKRGTESVFDRKRAIVIRNVNGEREKERKIILQR